MKQWLKNIDKKILLKSLSWRAVATITTLTVSWIVTGNIMISVEIAGAEVVIKTLIYYIHEMFWKDKK